MYRKALFFSCLTLASLAGTYFAAAQPAPATVRYYQFVGVLNSQTGAQTGSATVFVCTNYSDTTISLRFLMRNWDGRLQVDQTFTVNQKRTYTFSTKDTVAYDEDSNAGLNTTSTNQGSMVIAASDAEVLCSGYVVNAGSSQATGISLLPRRFSAMPDSME